MRQLADELIILLRNFNPLRDGIDILLVSFLFYKVLMLIRGTRAWRIVLGAGALFVLLVLSYRLRLDGVYYILNSASVLVPFALVILLLPELRLLIEGLPRLRFPGMAGEDATEVRTIEEIVAAVTELAAGRVGALIVIATTDELRDLVDTGVMLNARVSSQLLGSIFYEGNPLHDGAVILRGDTLVAAACRLPLSESRRVDRAVHMRHRAALGASEAYGCIALAVSEERGTISLAKGGVLTKLSNPNELREHLNAELRHIEDDSRYKNLLPFRTKAEAKQ